MVRALLTPMGHANGEGRTVDAFPADDRRDLVIDVVAEVPILLVDGAEEAGLASPTFYLQQAFADPADKLALSILRDCFPNRRVVGIDCRELIWGLGTFHCLTQQQPKV